MKTTQRRIALLTGASISALGVSALGLASPAFAAPHDGLAGPTTVAGTSTTSSPITICDIAGANPCFYGVYNTGAGLVAATVNSACNRPDLSAWNGRYGQHFR